MDRSGHVKGHDFTHFYVLGQIGAERATSDLYSYDAQSARLDAIAQRFPGRFLPVYPPQTAIALAPLGRLPYLTALGVWWGLSLIVYAACCWCLWRFESSIRWLGRWPIVILAAGYAPLHSVIASGQTSAFALGLFTLAWVAFRFRRPFLAGVALGALAYKPSLGLVFPIVFLVVGEFTALAGAAISIIAQLMIAAAWFGTGVFHRFLDNARSLVGQVALLEPQPWQMHSLRSFFSLLLPWSGAALIAYVSAAVVLIWVAIRAWRSNAPLSSRYAVLVLVTLLVDPHVNSYDLVMLICALLLAGAWILSQPKLDPRLITFLGLVYYSPALETVTRFTHFQISVPAIVGLAGWLTFHTAQQVRRA